MEQCQYSDKQKNKDNTALDGLYCPYFIWIVNVVDLRFRCYLFCKSTGRIMFTPAEFTIFPITFK